MRERIQTNRLEHSVCGDLDSETKRDDSSDHRLGEHGCKVEGGGWRVFDVEGDD
jgi:hypothetical protein